METAARHGVRQPLGAKGLLFCADGNDAALSVGLVITVADYAAQRLGKRAWSRLFEMISKKSTTLQNRHTCMGKTGTMVYNILSCLHRQR